MIVADVQTDVDEETSNCSEVKEAYPVKLDVDIYTRAFCAVSIMRFDFHFADADLIVKHSISSAVSWPFTTKM